MRLIGTISDSNMPNVTFDIDGDFKTQEELKKLENQLCVLEVTKYREKKSLSANGYFWHLVGEMARVLGTDKDSVYKWMLKDAGVFVHLEVVEDAIPTLQRTFRYVEEVGRHSRSDKETVEVLAYYGTSTYNTQEMSHLITVTREEAKRLGIDVWTEEEIKQVLGDMKQ